MTRAEGSFGSSLKPLAEGFIVPNSQTIDGPSRIDGGGDVFLKHRKYTSVLSYVFFVVAIIWVLGTIAVCIFYQEAHWSICVFACIPGAISGWLRNRARGVKEESSGSFGQGDLGF